MSRTTPRLPLVCPCGLHATLTPTLIRSCFMVTTDAGSTVMTVFVDAAQFRISGFEDGSMLIELYHCSTLIEPCAGRKSGSARLRGATRALEQWVDER